VQVSVENLVQDTVQKFINEKNKKSDDNNSSDNNSNHSDVKTIKLSPKKQYVQIGKHHTNKVSNGNVLNVNVNDKYKKIRHK
jgi:hypothetical protein